MDSSDRTRQIGVTLAEIFCVLGTLVGVGVIGTRVEESSGGSLSADATLLAPAGPAFSIWSVIYVGLAAYTVWQWLPAAGRSELARRTGWLFAASMVLNAAWLLVTQQGWIWLSVLVILALLRRARPARPRARLHAGRRRRPRWGPGSSGSPPGSTSDGSPSRRSPTWPRPWRTAGSRSPGARPAVAMALVALVVVVALAVALLRLEPTRLGVAARRRVGPGVAGVRAVR